MELNYERNPLLELDQSQKYKVIEVYDTRGNKVDRLACMGPQLPNAKLNSLRIGARWTSPKEERVYERVR